MKSSILLSIAAIAAQVIALPTHDERSVALPVRDMEFAASIDVRPKLRRNKAKEAQAEAAEDDEEDAQGDAGAEAADGADKDAKDKDAKDKDAKDAKNKNDGAAAG
ncbi:hypothetical protein LY78DRAFT_676417, partial [Colletotrichum sublineola]